MHRISAFIISAFILFTFSLAINLKWTSSIHYIVEFCFIIHSSTLCLLIGEFNQFMFRAVFDKEGLTIAILFIVFCLFWEGFEGHVLFWFLEIRWVGWVKVSKWRSNNTLLGLCLQNLCFRTEVDKLWHTSQIQPSTCFCIALL